MLSFVERLSPCTAGTVYGLLAAAYALLVMWLVTDGQLFIFESIFGFVVVWFWSTGIVAERRERLNLPGEPPLTADERILATRACASGRPSDNPRIRSASAKIARGWSRPSPLKKRDVIVLVISFVAVAVIPVIESRPTEFLCLPLYGGLLAYTVGSDRRHRRLARTYVMALEEIAALQSAGQTEHAETAD